MKMLKKLMAMLDKLLLGLKTMLKKMKKNVMALSVSTLLVIGVVVYLVLRKRSESFDGEVAEEKTEEKTEEKPDEKPVEKSEPKIMGMSVRTATIVLVSGVIGLSLAMGVISFLNNRGF